MHDCKFRIKEREVGEKITREFNAFKLKFPECRHQIKVNLLNQP